MGILKYITIFEKKLLKKKKIIPQVGNRIRVGVQIREADKQRIQFFEGIVISKKSSSTDLTITVRKIFQGIGVERTFPIYSPQIKSFEILTNTKTNRAKLFYLRNRIGKAATRIQVK